MDLLLQPFTLIFKNNNVQYRLQVQQISVTKYFEQFQLTGGQRTIIVQSNRPAIRAAADTRKISWLLIEGEVSEPVLQAITAELEREIFYKERPSSSWGDQVREFS